MRGSAEQGAKVPVRHGDLGNEDRQDEHRQAGGLPRSRAGHVEDQGDHSDDRSDGHVPRKGPHDSRGPTTVKVSVDRVTDPSPIHMLIVPNVSPDDKWLFAEQARLDP
jgi:hypothetical protein